MPIGPELYFAGKTLAVLVSLVLPPALLGAQEEPGIACLQE